MFSPIQGQSGVVAGGGLLPFMVGGGQAVGGRPMSGVDSYQGAQVSPVWVSSGGSGLGGGIFCAGAGGGAGLGGADGGGRGPKRGAWKPVTDFSVLREVMTGSRPVRRIESIPESGPQRDAIVLAVEAATKSVLVPRPDNFTPPARTPWGGTNIRELMGLAEGDIVGEAWAVSGHPSFPNRFIFAHDGEYIEIPFTLIGELFPDALYGPANVAHFGNVPPFLTKLLDARENLSIQVHPTAAYAASRPEKNWHSKTEMWVILGADKGAGLYLGLKEGVTREEFAAAVENGDDVSKFLNFVPVRPGNVYFIPAGTPHAIGAGVLLAEHQETSETTFRLYSWGDGRELHKKDGVAAIDWDAPRGEALAQSLRRMPSRIAGGEGGMALHENMAVEPEFSFDRVSFPHGKLTEFSANASQGMHGITVIEGAVELYNDDKPLGRFEKGQSFIIPAAMGKYRLVGSGDGHGVVFIGRSGPRDVV